MVRNPSRVSDKGSWSLRSETPRANSSAAMWMEAGRAWVSPVAVECCMVVNILGALIAVELQEE